MYDSSWYRASPVFLQNAAITARGIASRLLRGGAMFRRLLAEFEENQWRPRDELRAMQDERLAALIRHCYQKVPYYREIMDARGLKPADVTTVDDLPKLPFLTKEIVRTQGARIIREDLGRIGIYRSETSGTTGMPLKLVRDSLCVNMENAALWRVWRSAGMELWDRRITVRGDLIVPPDVRTPPYWRYNASENQMLVSFIHLSAQTVGECFAAMRSYGPRAIDTVGSAAYYLAQEALERGESFHVDFVLCGSEPVYPHMREAIERAFSCEVVEHYGQSERAAFAMQCPEHSGLHLAEDYGITELVEPDWDAPAGLMEIVGTSLNNYAMPLIRYRTEDLTRPLEGECPCGRTLPRIAGIETRSGALIVTPDGRRISYLQFTRIFGKLAGIKKSQVIQDALDHFLVRLVPAEGFTEDVTTELTSGIRDLLNTDVAIDVVLVDDIAWERSGKYKWFVSELDEGDIGTG
jgi:phenylacetate-CoA ligase